MVNSISLIFLCNLSLLLMSILIWGLLFPSEMSPYDNNLSFFFSTGVILMWNAGQLDLVDTSNLNGAESSALVLLAEPGISDLRAPEKVEKSQRSAQRNAV